MEERISGQARYKQDTILGRSFGFFIRYTLECYQRVNYVSNKLRELGSVKYLYMFKYINTISPQMNDLLLAKKVIISICKSRYGESFIEGYLTRDKPNWQIIKEFMLIFLFFAINKMKTRSSSIRKSRKPCKKSQSHSRSTGYCRRKPCKSSQKEIQ